MANAESGMDGGRDGMTSDSDIESKQVEVAAESVYTQRCKLAMR